jgi:hypothetical protein
MTPEHKAKMQAARLANADAPRVLYINAIDKLAKTKPTRALAIKAHCQACTGCTATHNEAGSNTEIKNCTVTSCPLHFFRPYK